MGRADDGADKDLSNAETLLRMHRLQLILECDIGFPVADSCVLLFFIINQSSLSKMPLASQPRLQCFHDKPLHFGPFGSTGTPFCASVPSYECKVCAAALSLMPRIGRICHVKPQAIKQTPGMRSAAVSRLLVPHATYNACMRGCISCLSPLLRLSLLLPLPRLTNWT